jgi:hypothetical protein
MKVHCDSGYITPLILGLGTRRFPVIIFSSRLLCPLKRERAVPIQYDAGWNPGQPKWKMARASAPRTKICGNEDATNYLFSRSCSQISYFLIRNSCPEIMSRYFTPCLNKGKGKLWWIRKNVLVIIECVFSRVVSHEAGNTVIRVFSKLFFSPALDAFRSE